MALALAPPHAALGNQQVTKRAAGVGEAQHFCSTQTDVEQTGRPFTVMSPHSALALRRAKTQAAVAMKPHCRREALAIGPANLGSGG